MSIPHPFTRQALRDLIWERPKTRLAPELGINASRLSQLCKRYEVVTPGYGYWTLRKMGRLTEKTPLGVATRAPNDLVVINFPVRRRSKDVKEKWKTPAALTQAEPDLNPPLEAVTIEAAAVVRECQPHPMAMKKKEKFLSMAGKSLDIRGISGTDIFQ